MNSKETHPISSVKWVHRDNLTANGYNPNHVAPPELALLELSILEDGWTQPIVIRESGEIVDGFHRWTVSGLPALLKRDNGFVPVVTLSASRTLQDQMLSTVRHNRARGVHGILPMAHIVRDLLKEGLSPKEIQSRCGMEQEEVERLQDRAGLPDKITRTKKTFSPSWVPSREKEIPGDAKTGD